MIAKVVPQGLKHASAAPGANTNIFSTSLIPATRAAFRVTVSLATASVFNCIVSTATGSSPKTCSLNGATALSVTTMYTFTFGVDPTCSYNFQVATDGVINYLCVEEIQGAVT